MEGFIQNSTSVILWANLEDYGILAVENSGPYDFAGLLQKTGSDIRFNNMRTDFYFGSNPPSRNVQPDFMTVLIHELGHTKGLHHPPDNSQIMYSNYPDCTGPLRGLSSGDIVGARYQHTPSTVTISDNSQDFVFSSTGGKTINFGANINVSSGKWFELEASVATINLNGYYIKNTGGTFIDAGGNTWNPNNISITQGSTLMGHYSYLMDAINNVVSGQTINVYGGSHTVSQAVTLPSGCALALNSGTSVAFNGGLTVNGTLITNGATLTFASGTGMTINGSATCTGTTFTGSSWSGIIFNSSNVSFTSNTIRNASTGAAINANLNYFQYNDIFYCGTGLSYNNSTTSTLFMYNRVYFNTYGIIYSGNSSGLYFPCNKIADNDMNITISSGSYPDFGMYVDQGHNSIYGQKQYDISSAYSGTIHAAYSWWGQYPAYPVLYGTIDYSSALSYDPNPMIGIIAEKPETAPIFFKKSDIKADAESGIKEFDAARGLVAQKKNSEAETALHEVLNKYPDKLSGRLALITLNQYLKNEKRDAERSTLLDEIKSKTKDLNLLSLSSHIKAKKYIEEDKTELAAKELEEIINTNSGFENMPFVLYDLATLNYFKLDNKTDGEKYYNSLIEKYPNEEITKSALAILGKTKPIVKPEETTNKNTVITKTALLANYPNPFNPTTIIKYNIAENTNVTLKIFDVLGREVRTLVNDFKAKGAYEVKFDGNGLASGLYFYQLKAGNVNHIMKMVLTK